MKRLLPFSTWIQSLGPSSILVHLCRWTYEKRKDVKGGRTGKTRGFPRRTVECGFDARRCPIHHHLSLSPFSLSAWTSIFCAKLKMFKRKSFMGVLWTQECSWSDICFGFKGEIARISNLSSGDTEEALELQRAWKKNLESRSYIYGLPAFFFSRTTVDALFFDVWKGKATIISIFPVAYVPRTSITTVKALVKCILKSMIWYITIIISKNEWYIFFS